MVGISTTLSDDEGVGGVASMVAGRRRQRRMGWRGEKAGEGKGVEGEWCDLCCRLAKPRKICKH
jgi:hypothetical protein